MLLPFEKQEDDGRRRKPEGGVRIRTCWPADGVLVYGWRVHARMAYWCTDGVFTHGWRIGVRMAYCRPYVECHAGRCAAKVTAPGA